MISLSDLDKAKDAIKQAADSCTTETLKLALAQTDLRRETIQSVLELKGLSGAELQNAVDTVILSKAQDKATKSTLKLKEGQKKKALYRLLKSYI